MKKAFTLAEVMIVLAVIGILTAILLPVAHNATPNENILKFKKAHNTLYIAIRELVTSDKYYLNGDLGIKANGTLINALPENYTYFCSTISDVLNAKESNCNVEDSETTVGSILLGDNAAIELSSNGATIPLTQEKILESKKYLDFRCMRDSVVIGNEIILENNIVFLQTRPYLTFGARLNNLKRILSSPLEQSVFQDENGLDIAYKIFCIDIDGIPENATRDDCVNECPFGYGIRADGKILNGIRVEQWLKKSIQEKN